MKLREILSRDVGKVPAKPDITYCSKCGEVNSLVLVEKNGTLVWEVYCGNLRCVK